MYQSTIGLSKLTKHIFKTSGIARSGFEYQDLIGIDVLLRFYRDPNLFRWVELESEEKRVGRLDDVVAARTDNTFELLQVKFTSEPDKYFLDWDWLLTKKKRGTSFLQKWSAALVNVTSLGPVNSAKLRTNRRPAADFANSLQNGFVDFDKIDAANRTEVEAELGGEAAARTFFSQFEFAHSEPLINDLEANLKGEIVPTDTDNTGWLLLREAARRWSTNKKEPVPDGKIRHDHLVQIITKRRPKPIPQDFEIPALYQVPAKSFHDGLLKRIKSGPSPMGVLWGSPGRGKSTYLSYLVEVLRKEDLPAIRHHYFLSLDDSTVDRISFTEICTSLMDQMTGRYPDAVRGQEDSPDQVRKWLEACGAHYAKEGKRFYVVVDGLDHVWRERRNTAQMEHLFNYLLPCPPNVVLLIGTQKVTPEQLPLKLLQTASHEDWLEVPPMDEAAVHEWLKGQKDAGRLLLRDLPPHPAGVTALSDVSSAFYKISNGNPLHLIYSFEALVRRGVVVTAEEVSLMPACPEGDIRKYYGGLWGKLPTGAKQLLHLIAGSDFHWPADGLRRCAGSLDEVDHLLEHRRTGVIPFHGSILAYVRDQAEHESTFGAVLPAVVKWLDKEAPEYWRWAWLWIMRARSGKVHEILTKTTRKWVIDSLAEGWPPEQIVTILGDAEQRAFDGGDYSRTIELRSLKIRVQNGQDYQTNRFGDFQESAIRLSANEQQLLNMADAIALSDDNNIVKLVRCLAGKEKDGIGYECYEELRRQVNLWISLRHRPDEEFLSLAENFLEALVDFGSADMKNLLRFIEQFHARDRIYEKFLRHVVRVRNFEMAHTMMGLLDQDKYASWRRATQDAVVRIAAFEGIDLSVRIGPQQDVSPLLACWYAIKSLPIPAPCSIQDISSEAVRDSYDSGANVTVEKFFHAFFFASVVTVFQAAGESSPALAGIDRSKLGWMKEAINRIWETAHEIANRPAEMNYGSVFLGMAELEPVDISHRASEPSIAQYRALRMALRRIAFDVHSLKCARDGVSLVSMDTFELVRGSTHWVDEGWISDELGGRSVMFEPSGVKALIDELEATEAKHVTQFGERAEKWIDLAQLSVLYGLGGGRFVSRAADCILGYGWHKDTWIFDVLSAMEIVHESSTADIVPWMEMLAPIIDQITVFTDGDETNHAPEEFINLISKAKPDWLPTVYAYYLAKEEWDLAEKTLACILSHVDYQSVAGAALTKSLLDKTDLHELEKLHKQGAAGVGKLLAAQRSFLGIVATRSKPTSKNAKGKTPGTDDDLGRRGKPPNVTKFGPDELEALLKRVASPKLGYLHRDDALLGWMKHWSSKGKGLEVLKSLDDYFTTHDNPIGIEALLDEAFNLSIKYQGKAKAYIWLLRAHIERHGWTYYWDNIGRVQNRLELVATHYKDRWAEFIRDTSKPARYWEKRRSGLTIGTRWLVQLLILVDQKAQAVKYTETMVRVTKGEVHDQPIPAVGWLPS